MRSARRFTLASAVGAALDAAPPPGMTEWVCGYAVVTVYFQPWLVSYDALCTALRQRLRSPVAAAASAGRTIEIPVCYGGELGPDLAASAAHCGLTPAQLIGQALRPRYLVYFLGFLPGFAYLGGLPPELAVPRRTAPRPAVPAGAVGIAGGQNRHLPCGNPRRLADHWAHAAAAVRPPPRAAAAADTRRPSEVRFYQPGRVCRKAGKTERSGCAGLT